MKRIYIDEILKKGPEAPGPGMYNPKPTYKIKDRPHFSLRANDDPFGRYLEKSKKLPGPANYQIPKTLGKLNLSSKLSNSPSNSFSKA